MRWNDNICDEGQVKWFCWCYVLHVQGVSITCVCDPQGAIFNCFPTNYKRVAQFGELNKGNKISKAEMDQDEKVEIILASTALVAVIALFLRWHNDQMTYILLSRDFGQSLTIIYF